jgi:hypothetical protein
MPRTIVTVALLCLVSGSSGFSIVAKGNAGQFTTSLSMVDRKSRNANFNVSLIASFANVAYFCLLAENVLMGAGVAVAGLTVGIGLVAFTENQGERARARGSGLSEDMTTRIAGALLEDVEVSTVSDVASLTSQLESALKATGAADAVNLGVSEETKKRVAEEADDGW